MPEQSWSYAPGLHQDHAGPKTKMVGNSLAILPGLQNKVTRINYTTVPIATKPGVDIIFYCVQTYLTMRM